MAFQVFKRSRAAAPPMVDGSTIDLTGDHQVIVDLAATPPASARHLGGSPDDVERIEAWADRMRQKRQRDQAAILGEAAPEATSSGYWSSDRVGEGDDTSAATGAAADPARRTRLLGELGLGSDALGDDVAGAYRRLAKRHHPDRWVEADEETRRRNAEEMMRVNAVYRALRVSGDVAPRGRASTPPEPPAPGPR